MERTHAENAHERAEDVRLLVIDIYELRRLPLNVLNGLLDVASLQLGREPDFRIESFGVSSHGPP